MTHSCAADVDSQSSVHEGRKCSRPWTVADYRNSAIEAERRAQRTSWGDLIPNAKTIKPNRLIDIEIRNAARAAALSYKSVHEKRTADAAKKKRKKKKTEEEVEEAEKRKKKKKKEAVAIAQVNAALDSAATGTSPALEDTDDDEEEEGEIVEERQGKPNADSRARIAPSSALITPNQTTQTDITAASPPVLLPQAPPPPPVTQNPIPRARKRSSPPCADGRSMPRKPPQQQNQNVFPPIFVMTSSGRPQFSAASMVQAIRFFGPYLTPMPRDEELGGGFVNYQRYSIRQDKLWSFVNNIIQNSSVLSLEAMLLSVDCFGRTSTGMAFRCLLTRRARTDGRTGGDEILPVRTLFVMWLDFVLRMLDQSCRSNTAPGRGRMQGQQVPVDNSKRVEVMTANAIVSLISRFLVCLKSARHLEELKTEFSVDWLDLCNKTLIIAKRYNLEGLFKTCSFALSQLEKVRRMEGDASESLISMLSAAPSKKAVPAAVADHEAEEVALQFDETWQSQAASAHRDKAIRCPPGDGVVAGAPANAHVSASTLPEFERPDWMLVGAKKFHQCNFFDRNNFCKFGAQCRYAHIYRPPMPLPDNAPSESLLHFIYAYERGCPLRPTDFHVVSKAGADGRMWHTVALLCPKDGIIYHSAGGLGGHVSAQGVHFYSTVREAMAAVAGIIISALRDVEAISNYYGPFESPVHHKQALDTAAMEPPKTIALPNTSLTRTHSASPGKLMTPSQGNDEDEQ